jgi:hypothetical protein
MPKTFIPPFNGKDYTGDNEHPLLAPFVAHVVPTWKDLEAVTETIQPELIAAAEERLYACHIHHYDLIIKDCIK